MIGAVKKILVVVHQETSDPGLVGQLLRGNGYRLDLCCPAIGDRLPEQLGGYAGVIVYGGPMSANDDDSLPHIRAELDWIPIALDAEIPYLGICLGAQLLARVLGAKVAPHPEQFREVGYVPIQPTRCSTNPLACLTHVFHWHQEGFELPQDAELLATGEMFPNQAFRYGDTVYGLQFHPEITQEMIHLWNVKAAEQNLSIGQPYDEQMRYHTSYAASVERWLKAFLPDWLDVAAQQPQRPLSA